MRAVRYTPDVVAPPPPPPLPRLLAPTLVFCTLLGLHRDLHRLDDMAHPLAAFLFPRASWLAPPAPCSASPPSRVDNVRIRQPDRLALRRG